MSRASTGSAAEPEPLAERTINIVVYGEDPCPEAEGDEIVVCARKPEGERYRIPKPLRNSDKGSSEQSWTARNAELDAVSRPSMPGSCSVVGSYGQSGCFQMMMQQWFAERRANRR